MLILDRVSIECDMFGESEWMLAPDEISFVPQYPLFQEQEEEEEVLAMGKVESPEVHITKSINDQPNEVLSMKVAESDDMMNLTSTIDNDDEQFKVIEEILLQFEQPNLVSSDSKQIDQSRDHEYLEMLHNFEDFELAQLQQQRQQPLALMHMVEKTVGKVSDKHKQTLQDIDSRIEARIRYLMSPGMNVLSPFKYEEKLSAHQTKTSDAFKKSMCDNLHLKKHTKITTYGSSVMRRNDNNIDMTTKDIFSLLPETENDQNSDWEEENSAAMEKLDEVMLEATSKIFSDQGRAQRIRHNISGINTGNVPTTTTTTTTSLSGPFSSCNVRTSKPRRKLKALRLDHLMFGDPYNPVIFECRVDLKTFRRVDDNSNEWIRYRGNLIDENTKE